MPKMGLAWVSWALSNGRSAARPKKHNWFVTNNLIISYKNHYEFNTNTDQQEMLVERKEENVMQEKMGDILCREKG